MIELYTTDEVAEICHVSPLTVREWIKSKKIPASKPGRSYLISEEDLKVFLKERHG